MDTEIYMGISYYQRLKQMVQDKMNHRTEGNRTDEGIPELGGAYSALERQTVSKELEVAVWVLVRWNVMF